MKQAMNVKIMIWLGIIAASLFLGLVSEISTFHKYILVGAIFIIGIGLMAAIKEK